LGHHLIKGTVVPERWTRLLIYNGGEPGNHQRERP
jgi:hypothetical protein